MKKFTKEITALIASIAVSATVSTASATSEEIVETTAVEVAPTEIIVTTAGVPLPPDDYTEPTTEEFPPLAGEPTLPDEYIETTEEIPPLAGDVALPDGDIDGNGSFNFADVVSFSKYLMNKSENEPDNLYAADICTDGKINVFDLVAMKRKMIEQNTTELSENND
ncbi:MAG: hypothetical protein E7508_02500 [Ruminococcus sp.]|nr:hypothetical protein [Ruminococcus sp.]